MGLLDVLALALGDTHVRSRTDLYDEHGREAGGWRVVAALTSTVRLAGLLLDHRTHLEPGEQVRPLQPWVVLAQPLEPEGLLLSGAWHVEAGRGNGYRGVTVSVVEGDVGSARKLWRAAGAVRVHSEDATGAVIVADVSPDALGHP